jgi:hypothetical protein
MLGDTNVYQNAEESEQKSTPVVHSEFYSTGIDDDDGAYKGSGIVQLNLENDYQVLGRIPLTTVIQHLFNAFLVFTAFCALCLISIGQSLVGLVVIGYIQFMATICGATGSIFFFSFGDSVTKRKQALLLTSSYLILCLIVTLSLFITLIYWIATGLYGAQGPYFLACLIFSQSIFQDIVSVLMVWRMYVHL